MTKIKLNKGRYKDIKLKMMKFSHQMYLKSRKLPHLLRGVIAILFLVVGGIFMTNPLLPGWILVLIGIGIFLPKLQYKYIGKHFKSENIKQVESNVADNIKKILSSNPKWYHKYKKIFKKRFK